jgi:hypothetical protein
MPVRFAAHCPLLLAAPPHPCQFGPPIGQTRPVASSDLLAEENKDSGSQRHDVEQKNGWPDVQAEPQQAINDQVNREQNHPNIFGQSHDVDLLGSPTRLTTQIV